MFSGTAANVVLEAMVAVCGHRTGADVSGLVIIVTIVLTLMLSHSALYGAPGLPNDVTFGNTRRKARLGEMAQHSRTEQLGLTPHDAAAYVECSYGESIARAAAMP